MSKDDMRFHMTTALLECAEFNKIDSNDLYIVESKQKPNTFYIADKKRKNANGGIKCWFAKTF